MSEKEGIKFDSALVIKMKDALVVQGWKRPGYQEEKNLLGNNENVQRCFNCESEYYFVRKCNKKKENQEKDKEEGARVIKVVQNTIFARKLTLTLYTI